jgi:FtsH-binding integral membrane protein
MNPNTISVDQIAAENQRYIVKVYSWMCLAMIITGAVAMYTATSEVLSNAISNPYIFIGLIIVQFIAVGVLVRLVNKMSAVVATIIFVLYSILFGLTLSFIFKIYTSESIASTFFITSGTFGVMSAWGYFTKTDLTRWGNILFMGVIGIIIASLVNQFILTSSMLYWITTCAGVLIFVGLTAYDTQKIKNANIIGNEGSDDDHKESIIGALILYLDFINLFLYLLRIFGRRK